MLKLSTVIPDIVSGQPFLQFGLELRLLNLARLAKVLRPFVEIRAKKPVTESSIHMALSRLQRSLAKGRSRRQEYEIERMTVHTGLMTSSYQKSEEMLRRIHQLHTAIQRRRGYITFSESSNEVTVITEASLGALVRKYLGSSAKYTNRNIVALAIHFHPRFAQIPGFLAVLLQQIMLQSINVIEVASTFTEFVLYIDEKNAKLAFDTLYQLFKFHVPPLWEST